MKIDMDIQTLRREMQDVVENNILRFWSTKMVDHEHGGFYGRIDAQEVLHPEAEKGAILNARILWSFSAAYRVFSHLSPLSSHLQEYLEMATYAKDYFVSHFIKSMAAFIGVLTTKAIRSIRASSSMPLALPFMVFRNMLVPRVIARHWTMPCNSLTA